MKTSKVRYAECWLIEEMAGAASCCIDGVDGSEAYLRHAIRELLVVHGHALGLVQRHKGALQENLKRTHTQL